MVQFNLTMHLEPNPTMIYASKISAHAIANLPESILWLCIGLATGRKATASRLPQALELNLPIGIRIPLGGWEKVERIWEECILAWGRRWFRPEGGWWRRPLQHPNPCHKPESPTHVCTNIWVGSDPRNPRAGRGSTRGYFKETASSLPGPGAAVSVRTGLPISLNYQFNKIHSHMVLAW